MPPRSAFISLRPDYASFDADYLPGQLRVSGCEIKSYGSSARPPDQVDFSQLLLLYYPGDQIGLFPDGVLKVTAGFFRLFRCRAVQRQKPVFSGKQGYHAVPGHAGAVGFRDEDYRLTLTGFDIVDLLSFDMDIFIGLTAVSHMVWGGFI